jgi:murein DD-endopeptidase MepM/ murein hydrolase activator NlpD
MRTPIDGARLSSGFGRRKHPILGYTKLHRGVDFAAPKGTPIYAAGNGTIQQAGRNGAYGLYVKIRHNNRYSTAYAHMRAIARAARRGKRVTQGQIIGYVGTTGRSTGPHLHYEILAGGRRTNPMRIKMPSGKKLKGGELEDFQVARNVLDERYAAIKPGLKTAGKSTGAGIGAP